MNCVQSERSMGLETRIKPISYLKAHSAEVFRELGEGAAPLLITQNGEPKAVLQDVASYVATRELLALLKLLAMARDDMVTERVQPLEGLKERIRGRTIYNMRLHQYGPDGPDDADALLEHRLLQRAPRS